MANTIAWIGGAGAGLTWTSAFNASDVDSLASGSAVMSSVADIANGSSLDLYADVAFELAISSTTLAAGAALYLYLLDKFEIDGSTNYYGDNSLTSTGGTQKAYLPSALQVGAFSPTIIGAAQTLVVGMFKGVLIPPRSFRFGFGNLLGVTLSSSGHFVSYQTYKLQDNL